MVQGSPFGEPLLPLAPFQSSQQQSCEKAFSLEHTLSCRCMTTYVTLISQTYLLWIIMLKQIHLCWNRSTCTTLFALSLLNSRWHGTRCHHGVATDRSPSYLTAEEQQQPHTLSDTYIPAKSSCTLPSCASSHAHSSVHHSAPYP